MCKPLFVIVAFLFSFLGFGSPAFAQDGGSPTVNLSAMATLPLAKPNIALAPNHRPVNPLDYIVVVYLYANQGCLANFEPSDDILIARLEGEIEKKTFNLPFGLAAACTYMQVEKNVWTLNQGSERLINVTVGGVTLDTYAPYINRQPEILNYRATVTVSLPETSGDYFLVKTPADTCPAEHDGTGAIYLNQKVNPFEVTGGAWSLGVYYRVTKQVKDPNNTGLKIEQKIYTLLKGTCQTHAVLAFNDSFTYSAVLPSEALASYVPPVVTIPHFGVMLGMRTDFSSAGFHLRGEWIPYQMPVVFTAAFGMTFPEVAGGTMPLTTITIGTGYNRWHKVSTALQFNWNVQLQGGLGSVVAHCSPGRYNSGQVYTCGNADSAGTFPLVLTNGWLGPAADVKLVGLVAKAAKPVYAGVDLSFTGQVFLTSNSWPTFSTMDGYRTATVQTESGEDELRYVYDQTFWFVPALTIGGVVMF